MVNCTIKKIYQYMQLWTIALSVKEMADYSVIMVVGTTEDGKLLVLDVFRKDLSLLSYFLLLKKLLMIGMYAWFGVEDSSFGLGIIQMALDDRDYQ